MSSGSSSGFGAGLFFVLAGLYFLPLIVSAARRCKAHGGIAIVNLFLGWTFIGWVIALAWAASGEKEIPAAPAA